ncbi:MAG: glycine cleavage system protein GcvH [Candidatus Thermoplasmatota archaeon]|nr:glycine cleavage system protein GcvH [Candidatus Thermoplasmatota archaeon]
MVKVPENLKYTESHEWVRIENKKAIVGITDYAQSKLLDIVYAELPEIGKVIAKKERLGSLESVKAVADFYAPLSGKIIEINEKVQNSPELVNKDPYGEGWLAVLEITKAEELEELLTPEQYKQLQK